LDAAALAPQRAVDTSTVTEPGAAPDLRPLVVVAAGVRTPGRAGTGVGRPVPVTVPPDGDPVDPVGPVGPAGVQGTDGSRDPDGVVLVVPAQVTYREAAVAVGRRLDAGLPVAAVLLAADEGVLLTRRVTGLPPGVPVLDGVDDAAALACERLLVEVAPPDGVLRAVVDPLRLTATFALADADRPAAVAAAGALADVRNAVVGLDAGTIRNRSAATGSAATASAAMQTLRATSGEGEDAGATVGSWTVDSWTVDLDAVAREVEARRGPGPLGRVVATLEQAPAAGTDDVAAAVRDVLGVPVLAAPSEAAAARAGALTTPGARPDALVLDLGGGTVDLVVPSGAGPDGAVEHVVAGAGELVTAAVARLAGCSRGAADWVKRGPCARLDGPHVLSDEDGGRRFLDRPAPSDAVGSLVVPGPAGPLPFSRTLAPSEWRALRLRVKRAALGDNVARLTARAGGGAAGREVVLVGGVAGDAELLQVLDVALAGSGVGRADVAAGLVGPGALGHRWAVAYGLVVLTAGQGRLGP
ncbi:MAG: diol dehydratase reactivase ATPase-like domain-containing protein, partial [Kineosporiaceae bacterium]